jgi:predicted AAA+ superfamily ATPase
MTVVEGLLTMPKRMLTDADVCRKVSQSQERLEELVDMIGVMEEYLVQSAYGKNVCESEIL